MNNTKTVEFVLLSIYHTKVNDKHFFFWRPENTGYTRNLNEAGNYTNSPAKKNDTLYQPDGYHNTMRTLPIEKHGEIYPKLEKEQDTDGLKILNNDYNCRLLGITDDGNNLKRGIS